MNEEIIAALEELLQDEQRAVIDVICARIQAVGKLNPTSRKQLIQLQKWRRADLLAIKQIIAKQTKLAQKEIDSIFNEAAQETQAFADSLAEAAAGIKYTGNIEKLVTASATAFKDELLNLADTYAFKTDFGILPIRETYIKTINQAVSAVQSGTLDYNTAMRKTVRSLADSGLRNVYHNGEVYEGKIQWLDETNTPYYSRRVDSSVRMNVLDGVRQLNQEVLNDAGRRFGTGVELSAHDRPAPDHADIQGKQFTNEEFEQLNAGLERPIGTLNCMHIAYPIIYGKSKPTYTDAQLQQFRDNATTVYEYDGKKFNGYECTQEQRRMETQIRALQDRLSAFRAAGDKRATLETKNALREAQREYRAFSDAVGLETKVNRID